VPMVLEKITVVIVCAGMLFWVAMVSSSTNKEVPLYYYNVTTTYPG